MQFIRATLNYQLSIINYQLSTLNSPLSTIHSQLTDAVKTWFLRSEYRMPVSIELDEL
ncbi:MAG: hypothetical protein HC894_16115 [Microcoleus sp. SM1_3_4]|nr:hypothetical protein [Microcoleus sp. SM1_3_4]